MEAPQLSLGSDTCKDPNWKPEKKKQKKNIHLNLKGETCCDDKHLNLSEWSNRQLNCLSTKSILCNGFNVLQNEQMYSSFVFRWISLCCDLFILQHMAHFHMWTWYPIQILATFIFLYFWILFHRFEEESDSSTQSSLIKTLLLIL